MAIRWERRQAGRTPGGDLRGCCELSCPGFDQPTGLDLTIPERMFLYLLATHPSFRHFTWYHKAGKTGGQEAWGVVTSSPPALDLTNPEPTTWLTLAIADRLQIYIFIWPNESCPDWQRHCLWTLLTSSWKKCPHIHTLMPCAWCPQKVFFSRWNHKAAENGHAAFAEQVLLNPPICELVCITKFSDQD